MSYGQSAQTRIPVQITVDGVEVTGEVVYLDRTDMSVVILTPVSGLSTSLHVPWFAAGYAQNRLSDESGITRRGAERAERLLKELYDYSVGRPSGWGISRLGPGGQWEEVEFDRRHWPVKEVKKRGADAPGRSRGQHRRGLI